MKMIFYLFRISTKRISMLRGTRPPPIIIINHLIKMRTGVCRKQMTHHPTVSRSSQTYQFPSPLLCSIGEQRLKIFFLRTHMLARHAKEQDHIRRVNQENEENMLRALTADRKMLPKSLKSESKTRTMMFRKSLEVDLPVKIII